MKIFRYLLSIVVLSVLIFEPGRGQDIFEESSGMYSSSEVVTKAVIGGVNRLEIKSVLGLSGSINIVAASQQEVTVHYFKKARADSRSRAVDYIDLIAVSVVPTPKGITLVLRAPNPVPWNEQIEAGLIDMKVTVPESCFVEVNAPSFDIQAVGPFVGMLIPSSLGRLSVTDVNGYLELATSNRRVKVEKISGEILVSTTNSRLQAINITSLSSQARFKNEGGDINITGLVGEMDIRNSYGRIDIEEFSSQGQRSLIRGFSGPISIDIDQMDEGQLVVMNRFEDVDIKVPEDIQAVFSLAVEEGSRIEATDFVFRTDLIQPNRLTLASGEGNVRINSSIKGEGNIYITGVKR